MSFDCILQTHVMATGLKVQGIEIPGSLLPATSRDVLLNSSVFFIIWFDIMFDIFCMTHRHAQSFLGLGTEHC